MSTRRPLVISGVVLLLMFVLSAWAWMRVPAGQRIPVHWGMSGQVDRYGGKSEALLLLPLVALGMVGLLALIPRLEPRRLNLERSVKAYTAVWLGILGFLLVLHVVLVLTALGWPVGVPLVAACSVGALLVLMGNYLGKTRSNFFFGIRTPWTLSSELSWSKTHRLGGKLFVILGLGTIVTGLLGPFVQFIWLLGGASLVVAVVLVYSYVVWRADPDKRTTS
jgi:uncharacterized membrane protein